VAVCATVGAVGGEGELIKKNAVPCLVYAFTVALLAYMMRGVSFF
jgi:lactate permease